MESTNTVIKFHKERRRFYFCACLPVRLAGKELFPGKTSRGDGLQADRCLIRLVFFFFGDNELRTAFLFCLYVPGSWQWPLTEARNAVHCMHSLKSDLIKCCRARPAIFHCSVSSHERYLRPTAGSVRRPTGNAFRVMFPCLSSTAHTLTHATGRSRDSCYPAVFTDRLFTRALSIWAIYQSRKHSTAVCSVSLLNLWARGLACSPHGKAGENSRAFDQFVKNTCPFHAVSGEDPESCEGE